MRNPNAQDITKMLLEGKMLEDIHEVNIPVDPYEKEDSFAYQNEEGGISFNIPSNIETFVKNKELLNFYYECEKSNKYSEEQLTAIKDLLKYQEWKWLNKATMEDLQKICNPEYSAYYIAEFGDIMHNNRRVTADIFFNNTDPNSEYEFSKIAGLNGILCYLAVTNSPVTSEDIDRIKAIYRKLKEINGNNDIPDEQYKALDSLQYRICRIGKYTISEIIDKCLKELKIEI